MVNTYKKNRCYLVGPTCDGTQPPAIAHLLVHGLRASSAHVLPAYPSGAREADTVRGPARHGRCGERKQLASI